MPRESIAGETCRIYVASLSDYNAGRLHGRWIDATLGEEHIQEEVSAMLRESCYPNVFVPCPDCEEVDHSPDPECMTCGGTSSVPSAEEWAIHDTEGFCGIKLSEWESFANVAALADAIEEHGEAFAKWFDNMNGDMDSIDTVRFQEAFKGRFDSLEDYAQSFLEDTGALSEVPEHLAYYFDYAAYARDLERGGDVWTAQASEGGVYVFDNNV